MPRKRQIDDIHEAPITPPSITPEGEEAECISLAIRCAKEQLRNGTASSQVITHYLKLATAREQTELETMRLQQELLRAKTENLKDVQESKKLTEEALRAFRHYSGSNVVDDDYGLYIYGE